MIFYCHHQVQLRFLLTCFVFDTSIFICSASILPPSRLSEFQHLPPQVSLHFTRPPICIILRPKISCKNTFPQIILYKKQKKNKNLPFRIFFSAPYILLNSLRQIFSIQFLTTQFRSHCFHFSRPSPRLLHLSRLPNFAHFFPLPCLSQINHFPLFSAFLRFMLPHQISISRPPLCNHPPINFFTSFLYPFPSCHVKFLLFKILVSPFFSVLFLSRQIPPSLCFSFSSPTLSFSVRFSNSSPSLPHSFASRATFPFCLLPQPCPSRECQEAALLASVTLASSVQG